MSAISSSPYWVSVMFSVLEYDFFLVEKTKYQIFFLEISALSHEKIKKQTEAKGRRFSQQKAFFSAKSFLAFNKKPKNQWHLRQKVDTSLQPKHRSIVGGQ